MFNTDTELLFPMRVIPTLGDLRGQDWKMLIKHLSEDDVHVSEKIALTALVVRLAGCAGCNTDSFRAMKGCTQCSHMIIKRFKGNDAELMRNYYENLKEVQSYLLKRDQL